MRKASTGSEHVVAYIIDHCERAGTMILFVRTLHFAQYYFGDGQARHAIVPFETKEFGDVGSDTAFKEAGPIELVASGTSRDPH
jgi:hypothetical protein